MALLTARSSTIFIGTGERIHVYRSVNEIPAVLRRRLLDSTRGMNSATILIADKRGREELIRALQGRPSDVQCRFVEAIRSRDAEQRPKTARRSRFRSLRTWLELLLPVAIGASLWLLIDSHF